MGTSVWHQYGAVSNICSNARESAGLPSHKSGLTLRNLIRRGTVCSSSTIPQNAGVGRRLVGRHTQEIRKISIVNAGDV